MSVNRYLPHVLVLPEDDANRQIANGFLLDPFLNDRAIQVLPPAGGWSKVRDSFAEAYLPEMAKLRQRYMILLVDFDKHDNRVKEVKKVIPPELVDRVFVVGVLSEPEELKKAKLGKYEDIGKGLSEDCRNQSAKTWGHELLRHNLVEVGRMTSIVRPILFP
ncbi:MAG: hypothetical protein ABSG63_07785 [Spirochaetia bacterium]|jgi:hypothetical protein